MSLERRKVVKFLLRERGDLIVVAGLGSPVYDVCSVDDHPLNFYNWGAMGSAAMVGLGLALAQRQRPVVVFTGDGEMLMGLGAFSTTAQHCPDNLSILVLDNGQYAETGMQDTATSFGTDLAAIAKGAGLSDAETLTQMDQLEKVRDRIHRRSGTYIGIIKIALGDVPRTIPLKDGVAIKQRFMTALHTKAANSSAD